MVFYYYRRTLSPYGTRRMFHALRQTVTSKTPQQAGNILDSILKFDICKLSGYFRNLSR